MPDIYDFSFKDVARMSYVKRWAIIEMSKYQSLAEHSYNVAMISSIICRKMELGFTERSVALHWSLIHDMEELLTGDVPSTVKHLLKEEYLEPLPEFKNYRDHIDGSRVYDVVKVADIIDAIQFARKFCIDERKNNVLMGLHGDLKENIKKLDKLDSEWVHGTFF